MTSSAYPCEPVKIGRRSFCYAVYLQVKKEVQVARKFQTRRTG
jgi:hypothetical protein